MNSELETMLPTVRKIARAAGNEILTVYARDFDVETKADRSPLTEADLAAHVLIVAQLQKAWPDIPVLSEESRHIDFEQRRRWQRYWLVDPLDGTREFIKRNGEFTVNIALIDNHAPVLGVVVAPARDIEYYGIAGVGAWRVTGNSPPAAIKVRDGHATPVRVVGSRSHRGASLDAFLANIGEHEMVPMGSSLKLCLVADGSADIYPRLGPTSEWDTAAAHAVVSAAGGQVVNTKGAPLRYNTREELLNPHFMVIGDQSRDWLAAL